MDGLNLFALACAGGYVALQGAKIGGVLLTLRARAGRPLAPLQPGWMHGVAVLQPILGGDPLLEQVLADILAALPQAHFIWLLDDDDGAGLAIAGRLVAAHPRQRITCRRHGTAPDGANPKVFKLAAALPGVAEPVLVVLDDDTRLSAQALAQMVRELQHADLVTALPSYRDDGAPGARLMAQFVNNNAALTYLSLLPWMAPVSINGMCYAMHTEKLKAWGGFSPITRHLADDLALAHALRAQGAVLHQSTASVDVQTHTPSLAHYHRQMHRWFLFATLLLRGEPPLLRALIALLHGLPPLLLAGLLIAALIQPAGPGGAAALAVLLLRAGSLVGLQRRLTGRARHRPLASVLAELLQPLHLLHATAVRRIRWRTRVYDVRANDDFRHVP
jgi:ceramide glucosyltransferase